MTAQNLQAGSAPPGCACRLVRLPVARRQTGGAVVGVQSTLSHGSRCGTGGHRGTALRLSAGDLRGLGMWPRRAHDSTE